MTDGQKLALILSKMTDTENVTGCIPAPPPYGFILVVLVCGAIIMCKSTLHIYCLGTSGPDIKHFSYIRLNFLDEVKNSAGFFT